MPEDFPMPDEPVHQQSYLMWFFSALGIKYAVLLPLVGLIAFVVVLVLVLKGKGPALPAALMLIVPLPLLVGIGGVIEGLLAFFQVIAGAELAPKASTWAAGISMSLVTAWVGLLLTVPSYFLATIGMCVRSLVGSGKARGNYPVADTAVAVKP